MAAAKEANRAEQDQEIHKYCSFIDCFNGRLTNEANQQPTVNADDIRNLLLHMADFEYIREEFRKLYYIQLQKEQGLFKQGSQGSSAADYRKAQAVDKKANCSNAELTGILRERLEFVGSLMKHFEKAALHLHSKVVSDNREFIRFFSEASKLVNRQSPLCTVSKPALSLDEVI